MTTNRDAETTRRLHPARASGTVALILLFFFIGVFIAFAFALVEGEDWLEIAGLGGGSMLLFLLWARENHLAVTAPNPDRPARAELTALRQVPILTALVLLYVMAVVTSEAYASQLSGFFKGALQSLPIGLLAGWVVAFVYTIVESDEMVRRMQTIATAIGAGATLLAATVWGLVAMHGGLPDFASVFLFPAFAAFYSLASFFVVRRFA